MVNDSSQPNLEPVLKAIRDRCSSSTNGRRLVVGISGIDASGKGYIADKLEWLLRAEQFAVDVIHADSWLSLPEIRFDLHRPAEAFYERGLRLDEMFESLILPVRNQATVRLEFDSLDERDHAYTRRSIEVDGLDVVLVEGIFLFQRRFQRYFDLRLWVECDFETALHRAILRGQEGLAVEGTIEAYHSIYFPAQQLHFDTDDPRSSADLIVVNNSFAPQFPRYGA